MIQLRPPRSGRRSPSEPWPPGRAAPLSGVAARVKNRKLVQWSLAYLATAWLSLQVVVVLGGTYGWPSWIMRSAPIVLAAGFAVAVVLAWYHGERGAQRVSGPELVIISALLVVAGTGIALVSGDPEGSGAPEGQNAASLGLLAAPSAGEPVEQASVAVLPFVNLSADPEQEFFSDGLTEELLHALVQIPGLRVAARTSSFAFKGLDAPADSIARVLKVAYLVEGSVRKAGDRVRITAQLIDAATGFHRWSQTYDRALNDVFAVQDEIGRAVAAELRLRVGNEPLVTQGTEDPEAHTLVLQAAQAMRAGGSPSDYLASAEGYLREALRRDPGYARAHAALALVLGEQAYHRILPPDEGYAQAQQAARRALALDVREARAHFALGLIAKFYGLDFAAAADHLRRAMELDPSHSASASQYGLLEVQLGRAAEGIQAGERAVRIDPLSASARVNLGVVYYFARQPDRAAEQWRETLTTRLDHVLALCNLAMLYAETGRHAEAAEMTARAVAADPELEAVQGAVAYTHALAGRRAQAERALASLERQPHPSAVLRATIHLALGQRDQALVFLEQAFVERDDGLGEIGVDPAFDTLRGDPRFTRMLQRLGLG